MRATQLLLALALVTAGCLGSSPSGDGAGEAASDPTDEQAWANRSLYLTGQLGLTPQTPTGEAESVPAGNFYTTWTRGQEQPTWEGGPLPTGLHATEVRLNFSYTAETATLTTGPQDQGFPEFVVYVGTEAAPMAWASVEGPDVVEAGEVVTVSANLSLPAGGLVLPAGVQPVVKLAPVQGQGSAEDTRIEFLVNGTEAPSGAHLTARQVDVDEGLPVEAIDTSGTLAGSAYATGPQEDTTADAHEVEVDASDLGLTAQLQRIQGAGVADIDLELLDADGEVVARSVTPEDDEGLALYEPNVAEIGPGTWTLRVVNYGNAAVNYELTAHVLEPADQVAG